MDFLFGTLVCLIESKKHSTQNQYRLETTWNNYMRYGNGQNSISFSIVIMVIAPTHKGLYTDLVAKPNVSEQDDPNHPVFVRVQRPHLGFYFNLWHRARSTYWENTWPSLKNDRNNTGAYSCYLFLYCMVSHVFICIWTHPSTYSQV